MAYANMDEQMMLVERLKAMADAITGPITIDMYREYDDVMFGKKQLSCAIEKTVITSKEDISHILGQAGFGYEVIDQLKVVIADTKKNHAILGNGMLAQAHSLYSVPNKLNAGWIYHMFQYCDFVRIFIEPVKVESYVAILRGSMKTAHLSAKKDTIDSSSMIDIMKEKVLTQNISQIVKVRITFGVLGVNKKVLETRAKLFSSKAKSMRATVRHLPFCDRKFLLEGRTDIYIETDSLHPLFPFMSSELSEKGGTAWGINVVTKQSHFI